MYRKTATGLAALAMAGLGTVVVAAPASAAKPPCRVNGGGHYPPGLCKNASVRQSTQDPRGGGSVTFTYTGLKPGSVLTVPASNGFGAASVTVDANGNATLALTVPCSFRGNHTVLANGTSTDGNPIQFSSTIHVTSAGTSCTSTGSGSAGGGGGLPFTGANTAAEGAAGLGLLVVGGAAVVAGRRRRRVAA